MSIAFNTIFRNAAADISRAAAELDERQREVSSGRRFQVAGEDPAGAVRAVTERIEIAALDRYVRSNDSVESRLALTDAVLDDLVNQISSARPLAISARGVVPTAAQREAVALELEGIREAVFSGLNTRFRGTFLFAGTASTTQPFVKDAGGVIQPYQGNASVASVDVARSASVQVTFDGDALARGADPNDIFVELTNLIAAVRAGDDAGIDTGLAALNRAFDRVTQTQTRVGSSFQVVDEQRVRLDVQRRASLTRLAEAESADPVESVLGLQAATAAYNSALTAAASRTQLSLLSFLR